VGPKAGLDTEVRGKILCPAGDRTPIAFIQIKLKYNEFIYS